MIRMCSGQPSGVCQWQWQWQWCVCAADYPWRWSTPVLMNSALIRWIYLPDFHTLPNSKNLIGQCCVIISLCVSGSGLWSLILFFIKVKPNIYSFYSADNRKDFLLCVKTLLCCFAHRRPADFVLLMCASQQWKVFDCEKTEEWMVLAGENTDEPDPMEGRLFNPAPNFINCR